MAKVLAHNIVSDVFVEVEDTQIAHPWFSQFYELAKIDERTGKPVVLTKKSDKADE